VELWEALHYNCSPAAIVDEAVYTTLVNSLQSQPLESLIEAYAESMRNDTLPYSKAELLAHLEFIQEQQKIIIQAIEYLSNHPFLHFFNQRLTEFEQLLSAAQALDETKTLLTQHLKSQAVIE